MDDAILASQPKFLLVNPSHGDPSTGRVLVWRVDGRKQLLAHDPRIEMKHR
ncbi:MAG: hypothetical protein JWP25_6015 [Bradyrhizobium sp.]|nr:hypothetical protein [Bradyrhizobium sp.]